VIGGWWDEADGFWRGDRLRLVDLLRLGVGIGLALLLKAAKFGESAQVAAFVLGMLAPEHFIDFGAGGALLVKVGALGFDAVEEIGQGAGDAAAVPIALD